MTNIAPTLQTGTWRRGKSLVSWNFDLRGDDGEEPAATLRRASIAVLACLAGFASPNRLKWTTESGGENVATLDKAGITHAAVTDVGTQFPDVVEVLLGLDLLCADAAGHEGVLPDHGLLLLQLDDDQSYLFLSLDTDIYAARTFASDPDNRALAAVNSPRLRAFLTCLRDRLGTTLYDLESGSYRDQVSELGFAPPAPARGGSAP